MSHRPRATKGTAAPAPTVRVAQLADLTRDPRNANAGTERGVGMLEASLRKHGTGRSILVDKHGVIIAGNKTHERAVDLGMTDAIVVPTDGRRLVVVQRTDLDLSTDPEAIELGLADNRASEVGLSWDAGVLEQLQASGASLEGLWSAEELANLFGGPADGSPGRTHPDDVPAPRETAIKLGDVLELGDHRLMCGDATSAAHVAQMLAGDRLDLVVTSPPYNVAMKYRTHKDKADRATYLAFIADTAKAFLPHVPPGRFVAWNIGVSPKTFPAHQVVTLEACGLAFYRQIVWAKSGVAYPIFPSTIRTKRTRHFKPNYTHEVIQVFESTGEPAVLEVACGLCEGTGRMAIREIPSAEQHATLQLLTVGDKPELGDEARPDRRYANDVWQIAQSQATQGLRTVGTERTSFDARNGSHAVKEHPAPFPVEVPRAAMSFLTGVGEIVYDPFGGSGSTLIACEQLKRRARLMEIDPVYCQIVVDRWQDFTGQKAVKVA